MPVVALTLALAYPSQLEPRCSGALHMEGPANMDKDVRRRGYGNNNLRLSSGCIPSCLVVGGISAPGGGVTTGGKGSRMITLKGGFCIDCPLPCVSANVRVAVERGVRE